MGSGLDKAQVCSSPISQPEQSKAFTILAASFAFPSQVGGWLEGEDALFSTSVASGALSGRIHTRSPCVPSAGAYSRRAWIT